MIWSYRARAHDIALLALDNLRRNGAKIFIYWNEALRLQVFNGIVVTLRIINGFFTPIDAEKDLHCPSAIFRAELQEVDAVSMLPVLQNRRLPEKIRGDNIYGLVPVAGRLGNPYTGFIRNLRQNHLV